MNEEIAGLIRMYGPHRMRKRHPLYGASRALASSLYGPNKRKDMAGRTSDSLQTLNENLSFLAGVLTVLPFVKMTRGVQFQHDGEKILSEAHTFALTCKPSVASVRKMRKYGEKILRLTEKVEEDLRRSHR